MWFQLRAPRMSVWKKMINDRISFIEWMKALGMLVIVYGHTSGHAMFNPTLPANFKQIGVVFFIFSTGYLLANERRPWLRVFYNRLFELFLFGILFSLSVSIVRLYLIGDPNESNYLPFMLGLNVFFDAFPANPSLWYIGTYIHLLIVWALLLRHIRIRPWMFFLVVPAEIMVRALLMQKAGDFIAYQSLTNWMSVLLLGMYLGQKSAGDKLDAPRMSLIGYMAVLILVVAAWAMITRTLGVTESNPFGRFQWGDSVTVLITTAASISVVYLVWGMLGFQIFRRLRAGPIVQFFGRNSMIIFIIHMPFIFAFSGWLYEFPGVDSPGFLRLLMNLLIFYVGAGLLSELMCRLINPVGIRNAVEQKLVGFQARRKDIAN